MQGKGLFLETLLAPFKPKPLPSSDGVTSENIMTALSETLGVMAEDTSGDFEEV